MSKIKTLFSLPLAIGKWFYSTTIAPENGGKSLPPIRYDGDLNDIYLA
jgi:hypothetical protein